jgi:hypothetical protein
MMNRHPRLTCRPLALSLLVLFATLLSASVAQGADRKVLLENFTGAG